MEHKQYFATCKRCGKKLLMTYNPVTLKWIPCDPELKRFSPGEGTETYVTPEGEVKHGGRAYDGEYGYRKHRKDCSV